MHRPISLLAAMSLLALFACSPPAAPPKADPEPAPPDAKERPEEKPAPKDDGKSKTGEKPPPKDEKPVVKAEEKPTPKTPIIPVPPPEKRDWLVAGKESARIGDLTITVESAEWGKYDTKLSDGQNFTSKEDALNITIVIENKSKTKIAEVGDWRHDERARGFVSKARHPASLVDSFENENEQHPRQHRLLIAGGASITETRGCEGRKIRPGESMRGEIRFKEQPLEKAEWQELRLPRATITGGGAGVIKFRIPAKMIK